MFKPTGQTYVHVGFKGRSLSLLLDDYIQLSNMRDTLEMELPWLYGVCILLSQIIFRNKYLSISELDRSELLDKGSRMIPHLIRNISVLMNTTNLSEKIPVCC